MNIHTLQDYQVAAIVAADLMSVLATSTHFTTRWDSAQGKNVESPITTQHQVFSEDFAVTVAVRLLERTKAEIKRRQEEEEAKKNPPHWSEDVATA